MSEQKTYVGTKIIRAEPMDELSWLRSKGNPYNIPRTNRPGYKVYYPDGYVSWSPKDVFGVAYREITAGEMALLLPLAEAEG